MQYTKTLISIVGISWGLFIAPGCDTEKSNGGGGSGGSGGEGQTGGTGGGQTSGSNASSSSSSSGSGSSSSGSMSNDEPAALMGITAAHNAARASVSPAPATPIPPLTWSPDIYAVAQAYAEQCVFQHSGNNYGENIFATTGGATPQGVVDSWTSEKADYDYATNTCSNVCGHYTQVVWAKSLNLGCGVAQCTKNSPFGSGSWEFWVCNYDPPGNYNGEKPY